MTVISTFDREQERELLADWFDTTSFTPEPIGLPTLDPEPDDDEMTKAVTPDIGKVGPKGYIHGWIYVGARPKVGRTVRQMKRDHDGDIVTARTGHVSRVADGHVHVTWDDGKKNVIEHVHEPHRRGGITRRSAHSATTAARPRRTDTPPVVPPGHVRATVAEKPRVIPDHDIDSWAASHFTPAKKLPKAQRDALDEYSGGGYTPINAALRGKDVPHLSRFYTPDKVKKWTAALDKVMDTHSVPEDITVSRGVSLGAFGGKPPKVGSVLQEPAYLSTSVLEHPDDQHGAYEVQMHIDVPKGTPGYYLDGASHFPHEKELLLDKGLKLAITKASKRDGVWHVTAKVVRDA